MTPSAYRQSGTRDLALDAGTLRHLCSIESPPSDVTRDAYGQPDPTDWPIVRTGYFSIEEIKGREGLQSGQITADVSHVIKGRWTKTNIAPGMRVVRHSNGQIYKIQYVDNVQQRNIVIRLMVLAINEGTNP